MFDLMDAYLENHLALESYDQWLDRMRGRFICRACGTITDSPKTDPFQFKVVCANFFCGGTCDRI